MEIIYIIINNSYFSNLLGKITTFKDDYFGINNFFLSFTYLILLQENYIFHDKTEFQFKPITENTINELYNNFTIYENFLIEQLKNNLNVDDPVLDNIISIFNYGYCQAEFQDQYACANLTKNIPLKFQISNLTEGIKSYISNIELSNKTKSFPSIEKYDTPSILNFYRPRLKYFDNINLYFLQFLEDISVSFSDIIKPSMISLINKYIMIGQNINNIMFGIFISIMTVTVVSCIFYFHRQLMVILIEIKSFLFIFKYEDIVEVPNILDYMKNEMNLDSY